MISRKISLLIAMLILLTFSNCLSTNVKANSSTCDDVVAIFARGSGLSIGNSLEWIKFRDHLNNRLKTSSLKFSLYELGTASQDGHKYPAADVRDVFNGNALGAWISAGTSFDYGKSVKEGVQELISYFVTKAHECPNTKFVLAGYSQGAQIVGSFASYLEVTPDLQDKVVFVALFGDPKLHLPEGEGWNPPACRNEQLSPWRRIVEDCHTDNGSLGARKPYVTEGMKYKTGTWCLDNDFICGSSKFFFINNSHGSYSTANGSIDKAVLEIATKLSKSFTPPPSQTNPAPSPPPIDLRIDLENLKGSDVMILYDNSLPRPWSTIDSRAFLRKVADVVVASGGRVGILSYCGCNLNTTLTYHSPLQNSTYGVYHIASGLEFDSSFTDVSADLRRVIAHVQQNEEWKPNARHIIFVYSVNAYQQEINAFRTAFATTGLLNWHIYPLVDPGIASSFANLSAPNSEVHLEQGDSMEANAELILNKFDSQLSAELTSTSYAAQPGDTLTFDASPSVVYKDIITNYSWDFTSDGVIDAVTEAPIVQHAYNQNFNGAATVHLATAGGLEDNKVAQVTIAQDQPASDAAAPHNLRAIATSDTTATLSWEPTDNKAVSWVIYINDIPIARLPADRLSININDMNYSEDVTFGVLPLDKDMRIGKMATVTLRAGDKEERSAVASPLSSSDAPQADSLPQSTTESGSNKSSIGPNVNSTAKNNNRTFYSFQWLPYAIWGAVIAVGIATLSFGIWYLRRYIRLHTK